MRYNPERVDPISIYTHVFFARGSQLDIKEFPSSILVLFKSRRKLGFIAENILIGS